MDSEPELSFPSTAPSDDTIRRFWCHIAHISARTRNKAGAWIGSQEVVVWNANNPEPCIHCSTGRKRKVCVVEADHASCRPCRTARVNCDRKIKFLFDNTKEDYFPNFNMFFQVYNSQRPQERRTYQKTINKRKLREVNARSECCPSQQLQGS
ncbi:hypothetical protein B0H12DRAFT_1137154 [Mycena haematopus]|nr:hypothetical protein B0H12DRAFT_1137154 [Mycena haematopus]